MVVILEMSIANFYIGWGSCSPIVNYKGILQTYVMRLWDYVDGGFIVAFINWYIRSMDFVADYVVADSFAPSFIVSSLRLLHFNPSTDFNLVFMIIGVDDSREQRILVSFRIVHRSLSWR